jgi:hypothetical protein
MLNSSSFPQAISTAASYSVLQKKKLFAGDP